METLKVAEETNHEFLINNKNVIIDIILECYVGALILMAENEKLRRRANSTLVTCFSEVHLLLSVFFGVFFVYLVCVLVNFSL